MIVGARVIHKEWLDYPNRFHHLARCGRVIRTFPEINFSGPRLVEVRWDAGELGAPAVRKLHEVDELAHLWWRAT